MANQTSFPTMHASTESFLNRVRDLTENAQELYTHVSDLLVHNGSPCGGLVLDEGEVEALKSAMQRFTLR